jgi:hypothetical protein
MAMMLGHAIDEAFARLANLYGREFTAKFENEDIDKVKAAWLVELQPLPSVLDRIAWALHHLPERCPNAIQFRNLCQQAPNPQQQALIKSSAPVRGPTPDELAALVALRDSILMRKPSKEWAHDLIAKHERGEHVDSYPLRCAREVVGVPRETSATLFEDFYDDEAGSC